MSGIGRRMHEHAGGRDAPILADDRIDLAAHRKNQQLVRMVMQLRAGACRLVHEAEVHVFAFDHRPARTREMRRQIIAFDILKTMKRHSALSFPRYISQTAPELASYSATTPASLMTFAQRSFSALTNAPKASGDLLTTTST